MCEKERDRAKEIRREKKRRHRKGEAERRQEKEKQMKRERREMERGGVRERERLKEKILIPLLGLMNLANISGYFSCTNTIKSIYQLNQFELLCVMWEQKHSNEYAQCDFSLKINPEWISTDMD